MIHDENSKFRLANPEDAGAIRELVRAAYAKWVPVIGREPRPMTADYEEAVLKHRFDLVELGGQIVALVETESRLDHFWIENIAVRPTHQGRGLGSMLLAHADTLARAAGQVEVRLLTNGAMVENIALYERVGYVTTRVEPFTGGTAVYMSKRLT